MKKFLKNYWSTITMVLAIILGSIVGIIFNDKAKVLEPLKSDMKTFRSTHNEFYDDLAVEIPA